MPVDIPALATAYWGSVSLLTLNDMGVFSALASGGKTPALLAEELGCDARALNLLLVAGVSLGLLRRDGDTVCNGEEAGRFLVPGQPAFLGAALGYAKDVYGVWERLPDAVRSGAAQLPEQSYLGGDPQRTETFVRAMHQRAMGVGRAVVSVLELGDRARLLDVAGGSGAYAILACQRFPQLVATVCDLPGVLEVSRLLIRESGLAERVDVQPWDLRVDGLPTGHDAALVSGVLHRLDDARASALVARVHAALDPGACIALADVMLDGDGPASAALFGLNMLLTAPDGGAHPIAAHRRWLEDAGFVDIEVAPAPSMHTVVMARKP